MILRWGSWEAHWKVLKLGWKSRLGGFCEVFEKSYVIFLSRLLRVQDSAVLKVKIKGDTGR